MLDSATSNISIDFHVVEKARSSVETIASIQKGSLSQHFKSKIAALLYGT